MYPKPPGCPIAVGQRKSRALVFISLAMRLSRVLSSIVRASQRRVFGRAAVQICGLLSVGLVIGCHRSPPSPSYRIALKYDATLTRIEKVEVEKKPYIRLKHPAAIHSTGKI